ncbi:transporter [Pontibacter ramchanderi]|uniref:Outer membrane putative beta-barrel porin/alpha-amylase n=1 Tax=Pontibacter ramchanderi TaxID=1179743 RepID=A0A2N3U7W4_9BACT|nr:transporter [Pontibacter ramchanderi]PKV62847.1 outer membrane putative beta-barrel porin/alpha-amylase [Pontibacter ramchanderi]
MIGNKTRVLLLLSFLVSAAMLPAHAQQEREDINADRPDRSQGPGIVSRGFVQLEAGYNYQKLNDAIRTHAYPTALLRIGLLEGVELRLQGAIKDSVIENGTSRRIKGWGPLSVGTKVKLWKESGWRPEAALSAMLALPLGSDVFKPDNAEPQFSLGFSNAISEKLDLTYNLGYGWTGGNPEFSYGANITRQFIDRLSLYLEVFGDKGRGEPAEHQADLGLLFLLLPNLQFDLAAGRRLNKAAPRRFVTTGLAFRFPR